jgi:hypothetical protein
MTRIRSVDHLGGKGSVQIRRLGRALTLDSLRVGNRTLPWKPWPSTTYSIEFKLQQPNLRRIELRRRERGAELDRHAVREALP